HPAQKRAPCNKVSPHRAPSRPQRDRSCSSVQFAKENRLPGRARPHCFPNICENLRVRHPCAIPPPRQNQGREDRRRRMLPGKEPVLRPGAPRRVPNLRVSPACVRDRKPREKLAQQQLCESSKLRTPYFRHVRITSVQESSGYPLRGNQSPLTC